MVFKFVETSRDFDLLRLLSETGQWEFGIHRTLFGARVSANRVGSDAYLFDYCAADQYNFLISLFVVMLAILESYPEGLTEQELEQVLPRYEVKPINRDPHCWQELLKLRNERSAKAQKEKAIA